MMNNRPEVFIVGIGQTDVGELWDVSLRNLAAQALRAAREDAGGLEPHAIFVGNMLASSASHQSNLGALIAEYSGLAGKAEAVTADAAEASGGAALHLAYNAIRSGFVEVAAVVGVEKVTDVLDSPSESYLARSLDADYEASEGMTLISQSAMLMQRYLYENKFPREALAGFSMISHSNAVNNPHAYFRKAISLDSYCNAPTITPPFNRYDAAPPMDGAAALILTRGDLVPKLLQHAAVRVVGSSFVSGRLALHDREDPMFFEAAAVSVQKACDAAGMSVAALDFFEYSDTTTLHAIFSLEAAGLAPRGQGWQLATDGSLTLDGSLPVATMGGSKARGFPLGATGVYQAVEAALQLRGEAGANQVPHARTGMIQSLAGTGSAAATHLLCAAD